MRCRDVERWVTAYLEGDLDDNRASALRGHIRGCPCCEALVAEHVLLVESAAKAEMPDVPPELWASIEGALDGAEEADAQRSRLWLWWPRLRPILAGAALAGATALALFLWHRGGDAAGGERVTLLDQVPTVMQSSRSHSQKVRTEIERADQRYLETIRELRELAADQLDLLPSDSQQRFASTMQALELRAAQERTRIAGDVPTDTRERDALYATYRTQIDFLTLAATGDVPQLELDLP